MFRPLHNNIKKKSSMKSISTIHPAIAENNIMENVLMKHAPQGLTHNPVRFVLSYVLSVT